MSMEETIPMNLDPGPTGPMQSDPGPTDQEYVIVQRKESFFHEPQFRIQVNAGMTMLTFLSLVREKFPSMGDLTIKRANGVLDLQTGGHYSQKTWYDITNMKSGDVLLVDFAPDLIDFRMIMKETVHMPHPGVEYSAWYHYITDGIKLIIHYVRHRVSGSSVVSVGSGSGAIEEFLGMITGTQVYTVEPDRAAGTRRPTFGLKCIRQPDFKSLGEAQQDIKQIDLLLLIWPTMSCAPGGYDYLALCAGTNEVIIALERTYAGSAQLHCALEAIPGVSKIMEYSDSAERYAKCSDSERAEAAAVGGRYTLQKHLKSDALQSDDFYYYPRQYAVLYLVKHHQA